MSLYSIVIKFIDVFYTGILGATNYWFSFEWQHHSSIMAVYGLAGLPGASDLEHVLANSYQMQSVSIIKLIITLMHVH